MIIRCIPIAISVCNGSHEGASGIVDSVLFLDRLVELRIVNPGAGQIIEIVVNDLLTGQSQSTLQNLESNLVEAFFLALSQLL